MATTRYSLRPRGSASTTPCPPRTRQGPRRTVGLSALPKPASTSPPSPNPLKTTLNVTFASPLSGSVRFRARMHSENDSDDPDGSDSDLPCQDRPDPQSADDIDSADEGVADASSSEREPSNDESDPGGNNAVVNRPPCGPCCILILIVVGLLVIVGLAIAWTWRDEQGPRVPSHELLPCAFFPDLNRLLNSPYGLDAEQRHFARETDDDPWLKPRRTNDLQSIRLEKQHLVHTLLGNTIALVNASTTPSWINLLTPRCSDIGCELARAAARVAEILSLDHPPRWSWSLPTEAVFLAHQRAYLERSQNQRQASLNRVSVLDQEYGRLTATTLDKERIYEIEKELNDRLRPDILIKTLTIVKLSCWIKGQDTQIASSRAAFTQQVQDTAWAFLRSHSKPPAAAAIDILQTWKLHFPDDADDEDEGEVDEEEEHDAASDDILNAAAMQPPYERSCAKAWAEQHLSHCLREPRSDTGRHSHFWTEFLHSIPISLSSPSASPPAASKGSTRSWRRYLIAPGSAEWRGWNAGGNHVHEGHTGTWVAARKKGGGVLVDVTSDTPTWPGMIKWWRKESESE